MLRLKQALAECKIPQQHFVAASGWSKSLVSRALNTGEMPRDRDKFLADVKTFASGRPELEAWLTSAGMTVERLIELIPDRHDPRSPLRQGIDPGHEDLQLTTEELTELRLDVIENRITQLVGRTMLAGSITAEEIISLTKSVCYLVRQCARYAGPEAPVIMSRTVAVLRGDQ